MLLDSLLQRRLVFLSGKGGVGKSVVGLALALAARRRGKRVLLVEIEAPVEAARLLGAPPSRGHEVEARPGLHTLNLDPGQVMAEYVRRTLHIEMFVRRVLESPIYQRFFAAAPGLPELMVLGKIMDLEQQRVKGQPRHDLVLVDAPATGHGLAFLKVPQAASAAIPVGPVGNNARSLQALLRDHSRAALVVVAVPEEMAVVEAVQFHAMAREEVGIDVAGVVLNACYERRFTREQESEILRMAHEGAEGTVEGIPLSAALLVGRSHIRRQKLTRFYQGRLRRALPGPLVCLPHVFRHRVDGEALESLADRLEAA